MRKLLFIVLVMVSFSPAALRAVGDIYPTVQIDTLKIGDLCPDYAFKDTAGVEMSLKSLRGKYVFIDVWASWCYPCRQQFPHLKELEKSIDSDEIVFLGVNIDKQDFRWIGDVQNLSPAGLQWKVLDDNFKKQFNMKYIPRCIVLDKEGKILRYKMTLPSNPETKEYLTQLPGL